MDPMKGSMLRHHASSRTAHVFDPKQLRRGNRSHDGCQSTT